MSLNTPLICDLILIIRQSIIDNEAEIESLDRAIGDGDHYINIRRGLDAIAVMINELTTLKPDEALNKIGMKLLSVIGGASGPLLASFMLGMAKVIKENGIETPLQATAGFAAGVQGLMQRGKGSLGEKTMLDVLIPVSTTFTTMAASGESVSDICLAVSVAADKGLESTRDLIATKGRAVGLGERAIGHLDAGAKSCQIMTHAVCNRLIALAK